MICRPAFEFTLGAIIMIVFLAFSPIIVEKTKILNETYSSSNKYFAWNPKETANVKYIKYLSLKSDYDRYNLIAIFKNNTNYMIDTVKIGLDTYYCPDKDQEKSCVLTKSKKDIILNRMGGEPNNIFISYIYPTIENAIPDADYKFKIVVKDVATGIYIKPQDQVAMTIDVDTIQFPIHSGSGSAICGGGEIYIPSTIKPAVTKMASNEFQRYYPRGC